MELIKKRAIADWGVFIERLDHQKTHTIKIINPKSLV
jgi:hypothetical protein